MDTFEEQLAIEALASEPSRTAAFGKTSREAAKLVTSHWRPMRSLALKVAPTS